MTPIVEGQPCALHEAYEKWHDERWKEQGQKNEALFSICATLQREIASIKIYMAWIAGLIAAVQFFSPIIWKFMGVK